MSLLLPKASGESLTLGIMGGTFDPIHIGHLVTAEEARQQFKLDHVIFIPAGTPPHKDEKTISSAEHRYLMSMLAVVDNPYFTVSRLEIESKHPSYTVDTVRRFFEIYQEKLNLYFITGADAILDITTWKDYKELLEACSFIAASRPGYSFSKLKIILGPAFPHIIKKVHLLEIPAMAISSTYIRRRIAEGKTIKYLTPEPVEQYIYKNRLYIR
ncbi:MAG: nicotinate-nucleotide adenylyltransferase [Dethiobacter sp.]|jgi:nicotinate-nucleotide adenylyltransferase|nr:MAG: nicotinate-nucleotide adenylyltransferase [Dethiobacter sp.]